MLERGYSGGTTSWERGLPAREAEDLPCSMRVRMPALVWSAPRLQGVGNAGKPVPLHTCIRALRWEPRFPDPNGIRAHLASSPRRPPIGPARAQTCGMAIRPALSSTSLSLATVNADQRRRRCGADHPISQEATWPHGGQMSLVRNQDSPCRDHPRQRSSREPAPDRTAGKAGYDRQNRRFCPSRFRGDLQRDESSNP